MDSIRRKIAILTAGREAERMVSKESASSTSAKDLDDATQLAIKTVNVVFVQLSQQFENLGK